MAWMWSGGLTEYGPVEKVRDEYRAERSQIFIYGPGPFSNFKFTGNGISDVRIYVN